MEPEPKLEISASRDFAAWLDNQRVSLAISTYQANKLLLLGVGPDKRLSGFERTFHRCMGLHATAETLHVATLYQLWRFTNAIEPGGNYNGYDKLYIPRVAHTTGDIDMHDLAIDADGRPVFVATKFNGIGTLHETHSFQPLWKPNFISAWVAEDRCHLNGMALRDGRPRYATCVGKCDVVDAWRERRSGGGLVLDIAADAVVATGLSMPHSPRFHNGRLWLLNAGTGEFGHVDLASGKFVPVVFCPGFLRGLAFVNEYAIVGLSRPRHEPTFTGLPLEKSLAAKGADPRCGAMVIDLRSGTVAHWLRLEGYIHELYDVAVLPGVRRPMALGLQNDEIQRMISLPATTRETPPTIAPRGEPKKSGPLLVAPASDGAFESFNARRTAFIEQLMALPESAFAAFNSHALYKPYIELLLSIGQLLPLDAAGAAQRDALLRGCAGGIASPAGLKNFLGALLFARPSQLPAGIDFARLPEGLMGDVLRYTFMPWYFIDAGECERHADAMRGIVANLHRGILQHGAENRWRQAALDFYHSSNFVPLYFCRQNVKDIFVQRAEIIDAVVRMSGSSPEFTPPPRAPGRKIRVGILLQNLNPNPESYLTLPAFWHLDRSRFEVVLIALIVDGGELEANCRRNADSVVHLPKEIHRQAEILCAQQLDVLLYGTNLTAVGGTAALAAHRVARVQATLFATPVTTGAKTIDAFISGRLAESEGAEAHYSERLELLEGTGFCFDFSLAPVHPPLAVTHEMLGISAGAVVFASAANFYKVGPELRACWARVLAAVPDSVLVLCPFGPAWTSAYPEQAFLHEMKVHLAAAGVGIERLKVVRSLPNRDEVKSLLRLADVYLDSFPYGGSTSKTDPLDVGLPIVALEGPTLRERVGAAALRDLGVPELVADSIEGYIALATKLARDAAFREGIASKIRERMRATPRFLDGRDYSRQVAALLERLVRESEKSHSAVPSVAVPRPPASDPRSPSADPADQLNAAGLAHLSREEIDSAIACFKQALMIRPIARVHNNLGLAVQTAGRLEEAESHFREALKLQPAYPIALNNLGSVLHSLHRSQEAIAPLRESARLDAAYPEPRFNLGNALHSMGDLVGAAACLEEAVRLRPEYAKAWHQLALVRAAMNMPPAAVAAFQSALRHKPDWSDAWLSLANLLLQLSEWSQARSAVEQALKFKPSHPAALAYRVMLDGLFCQWSTRDADWAELWKITAAEIAEKKTTSVVPFLTMSGPWSAGQRKEVARSHADAVVKLIEPLRPTVSFPPPTARTADGRLRIGYISGDFRAHPIGYLTRGLYALHDRKRFEIFAYSHGPEDGSAQRQEIVRGCDGFRDIAMLSTADAARRIHADGIHILVDLMGHTGQTRLGISGLRPAPVQAAYLGFPGTYGAEFFDYLIADPIVAPPGCDADFVEKLALLPDSYLPTDHRRPIPEETPSRSGEGLPDGAFVFCAFNNSYKIEPRIFGAWMRILQQVPGSVLWLNVKDADAMKNLRRAAEAAGISSARLVTAKWTADNGTHLARHRLAGLFLDTHFYNAHTGACDALWAGLPVVSWPGAGMVSRAGASVLTAAGLPELIAKDLADYERIAVRLATDPVALGNVRVKLIEQRRSCALFDTARWVRNLERIFEAMWERRAAGLAPEAIRIGR